MFFDFIPEIEERPKGKFFSGYFYWFHQNGYTEEEWGRMWAEHIFSTAKEAFNYGPLYMPTGLTRKREK